MFSGVVGVGILAAVDIVLADDDGAEVYPTRLACDQAPNQTKVRKKKKETLEFAGEPANQRVSHLRRMGLYDLVFVA